MIAIRRQWSELRVSTPLWVWPFPVVFLILRGTGALRPEHLVAFGEFAISLAFALMVYDLLSREARWNSLEVTLAAPKRKSAVLLNRIFYCVLWMLLTTLSVVPSAQFLGVLAPAVALGGAALFVSLVVHETWGIGVALGWWGWSLVVVTEGFFQGSGDLLSWLLIGLTQTALAPDELVVRKWVQAGAGVFLLAACLIVADQKKNWHLS